MAAVTTMALITLVVGTNRKFLVQTAANVLPLNFLVQLTFLAHKHLLPKAASSSTHSDPTMKNKTVLVTTGRQAKTLHVVRALKQVGARVVVTDTQKTSSSGVSSSCDAFHVVPSLDNATDLDALVEKFAELLEKESVDVVVPMCSINSALFYAAAKDKLAERFPHVSWICDSLNKTLQLDNKFAFADVCLEWGVPTPESGRVMNKEDTFRIPTSKMDVIIKRVESSMNRSEEILEVQKGQDATKLEAVNTATSDDPWQWQRLVRGEEFSAWYLAVNGRITFSAQYKSAPDLMHFEGMPVPDDVDACLTRLVEGMNLNGQFAFDYIREHDTNKFYVFECNPRGSSVLEVVSGTPGWGKAFFGTDMRKHAQFQKCGFYMHANCWPVGGSRFSEFKDAFFKPNDPLPLLVGEVLYPLELIRNKGQKGYHHVDANIGKIIVPGKSPGRNFKLFENAASDVATITTSESSPVPVAEAPAPAAASSDDEDATTTTPTRKTRVLHVFGSTSSEYYYGVSRYYVKSAWENLVVKAPKADRSKYDHVLMQGHPNGMWSLPATPSDDDLLDATQLPLGDVLNRISSLRIDVVVPHMYCYQGMTTCRGLFKLLRLPLLGNGPDAMALSTNKWHTRAIMASAGVPVAEGQLLRRGDVPRLSPPFILKPNREDNSQGITLFKGGGDEALQKALDHAFQFDNEVICEAFVPLGHEIRVTVLEDDNGKPFALPACEYVMERDGAGVRTAADKLQTDDRGVPTVPTKCRRDLPAVNIPENVLERCREEAFKAHRALCCRDYSIYDIRIAPDGTPYFLEASLYCSFAETSIIVLMDNARGKGSRDLFDKLVRRCRKEHEEKIRATGGQQLLGML